MAYSIVKEKKEKNRLTDRILVLKVIDGKKPTSSTGLMDARLFSGGNTLHAIMDTSSCLWYLKYDFGSIPPALRQRFTNFTALMKHTSSYFAGRNIEISEVID